MSTLAVAALGGDDRLRSRGQPVADTAATSAPNARIRFHELLATPRSV
jgi:hypothetical protein